MAKKFLVWKDKNCNGVNPEWLFLTGDEFYEFIQKEENKDRLFIKMPPIDKGEDEIIIEATKETYDKSEKERKRANYVIQEMMKFETVSVYTFADKDNADLYEKTASDEETVEDVVEKSILIGKLHEAIKTLNEEERKIVRLYYFKDDATERSVAKQLGISQPALHKKIKKILEKLKNLVIKSEIIR